MSRMITHMIDYHDVNNHVNGSDEDVDDFLKSAAVSVTNEQLGGNWCVEVIGLVLQNNVLYYHVVMTKIDNPKQGVN